MRIGSIILAAMLPLINVALGEAATLETIHGTWHVEPSRAAQTEQLTFQSDTGDGNDRDSSSFPIAAKELGIVDALTSTSPAGASFTITRDAGALGATGTASRGFGDGTFVFTPSETFRSRMHDRGYGDLDSRQLFTAFSINLTSGFIDGVASAGYPHLAFNRLVAFRALGVDGAFIGEMHATFPKTEIDADEMTSLRALAVSGSYVSQMRGEGFAIEAPRDAVQLRALNVNDAFAHDLAAAGYDHLFADELVQLRALGIDGAYIKRVQAHGFTHLPVDKLIQLKVLNVISARPQGTRA